MTCLSAVLAALVAVVVGVIFIDSDHFRILPRDDSHSIITLFNQNNHPKDQLQDTVKTYSREQDDVATGTMSSQEEASAMVNNYYNLATDFYEYGWGTSFHFAHTWKNESHADSMKRHEWRVAENLGAKSGDKLLDIGCGVGGPAREVARFSKAHVTGITINQYQVNRAFHHTKNEKMEGKVDFKQMDFTKMTFDDNSFNHAYAIESTCHAHKLEDVYGEAFRVLVPGGRFFLYEWITASSYDPTNEAHRAINRDIEYGNGLPPLRSIEDVKKAAAAVGFEVLKEYDLAQELTDVRPWWYQMQTARNWAWLTHVTCYITEMLGLAAPGTYSAHEVMLKAAAGLVHGGDQNVFTPMHLVLLQKPLV